MILFAAKDLDRHYLLSDGVVNLWEVSFPSQSSDECKVPCLDTLSVDSKAIVTLSLAELPQSPGRFVLAMGGLDNKIKLYFCL
ncbi:hypothetical protein F2Q68_00038565 [Brassica cretica]|uniref:Uncharacterized protein n=1 Tax=Brassica cretica TaxID=69181 RepID=A0A8S9MM79_BRACR|nr:hypothetical protein F2Q68_00038565 [Brassica cretica]